MVAQPHHNPMRPIPQVGTFARVNATIADLQQLPNDGYRYELVRGVLLRIPPPKRLHGVICHRIHMRLDVYCVAHHIADDRVLENIGYNLTGNDPSETVMAPDISFAQEAANLAPDAPYEQTPPLLAVEVASPSKSRAFMADKVAVYLRAGVQMVWVVWPEKQTVDVWTTGGVLTLTKQDTPDGGKVLPDFTMIVGEIFPQ